MSAIKLFSILFLLLMQVNCSPIPSDDCASSSFSWESFPQIPDSIGFAGSFAGIANDVLLVAGGANFPNGGTPWNGGKKTWYQTIFAFDKKEQEWIKAGLLPAPLGYGVSISTRDGLLLIGGSNENGHVATVNRLRYKNGEIELDSLPSLPMPLANACGALVDQTIYVAGGINAPDSKQTSNAFYFLDLNKLQEGWKEGPTWPGPSRMLAVAGASQNSFYLFSGTELINGERNYLKDAYVYAEQEGWKTLDALPVPVVAAPSPAWYEQDRGFFLFGGDDGALAAEAATLKEQHPGFSKEILFYDMDRASWEKAGKFASKGPVTTSLVIWDNKLFFPGGEVSPGIRTPNVLVATPCTNH